mmetsp:Transcript_44081/g.53290  ORF Transcript_44081/g.53290 Transcript_44081/m.53290 type:complete len:94 (+) Transcript_44081:198-479(+)
MVIQRSIKVVDGYGVIWDSDDVSERNTVLVTMCDGANECREIIVANCCREGEAMGKGWWFFLVRNFWGDDVAGDRSGDRQPPSKRGRHCDGFC